MTDHSMLTSALESIRDNSRDPEAASIAATALVWGPRYYACGCRVPDPAVSTVTASGPCQDPSRHGRPPQDTSHGATQVARTGRLYGCAKRGCDAVNPDYLSFGTRKAGYCLDHIPIRSRLRLWWQERHG